MLSKSSLIANSSDRQVRRRVPFYPQPSNSHAQNAIVQPNAIAWHVKVMPTRENNSSIAARSALENGKSKQNRKTTQVTTIHSKGATLEVTGAGAHDAENHQRSNIQTVSATEEDLEESELIHAAAKNQRPPPVMPLSVRSVVMLRYRYWMMSAPCSSWGRKRI